MKKLMLLLSLLGISSILFGCSKDSETVVDDNKLQVTVSFDAMYEFANAVGQDKVQITTIVPAGTEPHDFELKTSDIKSLTNADVFIYNGLGMEAWAEEAVQSAQNDALISVVASDNSDTIALTDEEEIEEHGKYDPHLWLSISGAKVQVQNIRDAFVKADPTHQDYYEKNATAYLAELDAIFDTYSEKFASLENKNFVTGHGAFQYFCRDFGLTQNSVEDIYAEGEPSPKQLTELVDYCKANHVTTIFAEELGNGDIANTLATEVGGTVETIYTMESAEDDMTYLERMESNCKKIYESLSK